MLEEQLRLRKLLIEKGILDSFSNKEEILEKGKKAEVGEIRTWSDGLTRVRHTDGWVVIPKNKKSYLEKTEGGKNQKHTELHEKFGESFRDKVHSKKENSSEEKKPVISLTEEGKKVLENKKEIQNSEKKIRKTAREEFGGDPFESGARDARNGEDLGGADFKWVKKMQTEYPSEWKEYIKGFESVSKEKN